MKSATLLTTQVDFTHAGDLKVFAADEEQIANVEREMATQGYLAGSKMAAAFNLMRSNDLIWPYVINNYLKGKAPVPFDMLYWNADATRMPAANHSFYLRACYLENRLTKGKMTIANQKLDLKKVKVPIYNLATREDHIAPARSVYLGSSFFGGPVRFVLAGAGHMAGVVNPPGQEQIPVLDRRRRKRRRSRPLDRGRDRTSRVRGGRTGWRGCRSIRPDRSRRASARRREPAADRGRTGKLCEGAS